MDLDNRTVTFQTDDTPQDRIAVRIEWALPFGELLKNQKNKDGNGANMSGSRHTPRLGKVVGTGLRMAARGCHGSPEVLTGVKRCLQTVPGPGGATRGQFRRNRGGPPRLINSGVGGMAKPLNYTTLLCKGEWLQREDTVQLSKSIALDQRCYDQDQNAQAQH